MLQQSVDEQYLAKAAGGTLQEVIHCLEAGANLQALERGGRHALFAAVISNRSRPDVARYLLAAGVEHDVALPNGYHLAHAVASYGPTDLLETLLDRGVAIDKPGARTGRTLLMYAASVDGSPANVRLLLSRGASVDAVDSVGNTALHYLGCGETIDLLLDAGASLEVRNLAGQTPLMAAIANTQQSHNEDRRIDELVSRLIARGADIEVECQGRRPIHVAVIMGKPAEFSLLLAAGADTGAPTYAGSTVEQMFHIASNGVGESMRTIFTAHRARAIMQNIANVARKSSPD